ncbi:HNH endonuclease [Lederbergia sp. NSJ-179]|uniref:HNH endonuclease n=1 Tax=Lederbergia sp. NSJ-179 TaxID=2931402 RepID=UPI001FD02676|nr:HNH endonuclease [Lederbergia sp. NSJ-179]MCJ7840519.1 HNH endonuclease [Lederbergia sp. NSJ-179]
MKYCGEQGCNNLISKGFYCTQHRRRRKRSKFNHKNKSFYNSSAWKQVSDYVYERDGGCCQRCGKFVFGRQAHRHHIISVVKAPHLKLDPDNIKLLCEICHPIEEKESEECSIPKYFEV